jgi:hypothetical protein
VKPLSESTLDGRLFRMRLARQRAARIREFRLEKLAHRLRS